MFATFQELDTLFNMTHSVHSYNALLRGIVCTLSPSLEKMFTVLQNMESSGLSANNDTMTHIIEVQYIPTSSQDTYFSLSADGSSRDPMNIL